MNRLAADQRGVIIVMFALMLPIMLGFIGLGVEVGYWFQKHRDLQAAADAAAVAGAYENAEGRSSAVQTIAEREAVNNGWNSTDGTITVRSVPFNSSFPASGAFTTDDDAVEIELTYSLARLFSGWFLSGNMVINARAVGDVVAGATNACVLALGSSNSSDSLKVSGSAAVTMSGCTAATNSTDDGAVDATSGLSVDCIYSAGGVDGSPVTTACSGPKTNQPAIADPYETAVTKPVNTDFDNCGSDGSNADGVNYKAPPSLDLSLSSGVYCDIEFGRNNETLILGAGTYYIDRGDFEVKSGGTVEGTGGVTIVLGDSTFVDDPDDPNDKADCGKVIITGASTINMVAPTSGNFSGLVFYRSSECDASDDMKFSGTTASTVVGAIYNPSGKIEITGTGSLGGTCLQLIADTIKITGTSNVGSACDSAGTLDVAAGGIGVLVE